MSNISHTNRRTSKRQSTSNLSRAFLDKLWDQCNWAHEIWTLRRAFIDNNRRKRALENGPHMYFISATGNALQEYVLLQIAKLHDPAVIAGRVCLTLDYVVEYGGWDQSTLRQLKTLKKRLDKFQVAIRPARNRQISHNDLATVLDGQSLGAFETGADKKYFKTLYSFVSRAYQGAVGGPCASFSNLTNDTRHVITVLASSTSLAEHKRWKIGGPRAHGRPA